MNKQNLLPSDITMVGGTMPGLMFYAGFIAELFRLHTTLQLQSISGTSAGAFIAALTKVEKHQETQKILEEAFGNDTGVWYQGVFGNKTIQGNLQTILQNHISSEGLNLNQTQLKTLSIKIPETMVMRKTENMPGKEVAWLLDTMIRIFLSKIGKGEGFHNYEVFDSSLNIQDMTKKRVAELISGSFQYSPVRDSIDQKILRTDGEAGSWHESSGTLGVLNEGISDQSNLLVLTRFARGHNSYEAVVTQAATMTCKSTVIGPHRPLEGNIISTSPDHMQRNAEIGRETAQKYIASLGDM